MTRHIVFGDVHGHYDEMMALYEKVKDEWGASPVRDTFVFIGDYVDGGNKSRKVINQLMRWESVFSHWIFLYGNHEDMLKNAYYTPHQFHPNFNLWYDQGGKATLMSYLTKTEQRDMFRSRDIQRHLDKKHLDWIMNLKKYHETEDYIFVHAGVNPDTWNGDMSKQSEQEMIWMRQPFIDSQKDFGKKIIFGHTTFREPLVMRNKIGIDTFFLNDNGLTALLLPDEKFIFQPSLTKSGSEIWEKQEKSGNFSSI